MTSTQNKLPKDFYQRNLHVIAKELLGKIFVHNFENRALAGKIVEVEAYDGSVDEASHSYNGRTKRNEVMFNGGGLLYVYFTYGMHYCANIVTGKPNDGKAILIRAVEPIEGLSNMALNRFDKSTLSKKEIINLTNGPAKFAQAFEIGKDKNGINLTGNEIFIIDAKAISKNNIVETTRIGIKKSVDLPWRYYIKDNPFVSKR